MDNLLTAARRPADSQDILREASSFLIATTLIEKISINLTVSTSSIHNFVVGINGILSFQAANFRNSRDPWVFSAMDHYNGFSALGLSAWETSGRTLQNRVQQRTYTSAPDAAANSPYIQYDLFFDSGGVYDLWGFGFTSGGNGVFWEFDGDTSNMRQASLGTYTGPPQWTKFGSFFTQDGGLHTFTVYLGDDDYALLDQWYFTKDRSLDALMASMGKESVPLLPLSEAPFNTLLMTKGAQVGDDDLGYSWLSSKDIVASGKYNYVLKNTPTRGISYKGNFKMDFSRIGGGLGHFPAWDYVVTDEENTTTFVSTNYGESFTAI